MRKPLPRLCGVLLLWGLSCPCGSCAVLSCTKRGGDRSLRAGGARPTSWHDYLHRNSRSGLVSRSSCSTGRELPAPWACRQPCGQRRRLHAPEQLHRGGGDRTAHADDGAIFGCRRLRTGRRDRRGSSHPIQPKRSPVSPSGIE